MSTAAEHDAEANRRAMFLHEAGHAVVGHFEGLVVHAVRVGNRNESDIKFTSQQNHEFTEFFKNLPGQQIKTSEQLDEYISHYRPRLTCFVGGIVGESVILGRPINAVSHAANDLAQFYGALSVASRNFRPPIIEAMYQTQLQAALERARRIVSTHERKLLRIAEELERQPALTEDEFRSLIQS